MTSPPEQNPVNGGRRGLTRVHRTADSITTNRKVAGSSPAERAKERPAIERFLLPVPLAAYDDVDPCNLTLWHDSLVKFF